MEPTSLNLFHSHTVLWFKNTLGLPTAIQEESWPSIAKGNHTLVAAPTGTGKTLSAFLVYVDRLMKEAREGTLKQELQLIYVSPLKSLAADIKENLYKPLNGIFEEERKESPNTRNTPFRIHVRIRTGDTTQQERRAMIKKPPHILITTPESLFLMLTGKSGQSILKTAKTIIIDELHALIDSKRGAHLMLSIARLDFLCENPLQRIGLSATIEPLEQAARYLSPDPVSIIAPKMKKQVKIEVISPKSDFMVIKKDSIWRELAKSIYNRSMEKSSSIVFCDGRAYAEKIAFFINSIGGEGYARTHHGSLSKEQRYEVEMALRNGDLKLLCATSSMELGIDVGEIEEVFQIGCPKSIASTMQRLGRAGHNPGRISEMQIFPRTATEGIYCGLTAQVAREGGIEHSKPPRLCLDVLAQHLVSMAAIGAYPVEAVMKILPRAYPFEPVTIEDVRAVLEMLAGDYEHDRNIPVRPRVLYDRIHQQVEGDIYSRMLAVSQGGTIPDKGLFSVKTENGVKLGEVDEEFVFESRVGDKFLLGTFPWQICNVQKDTVIVKESSMSGARPPFYKAEVVGRRLQTGIAFGKIFRKLGEGAVCGTLVDDLKELGLDEIAAQSAEVVIKHQLEATKVLPDDRTIVIEHFRDETGSHQMMVHSVFGRQVNAPLALLVREVAKKYCKTNISCYDDDDGFLLFPYGDFQLPEGLLQKIKIETAGSILEALLPTTPLFGMTFRYNAASALMMGAKKAGRQPLWVQRLRSAQMLDTIMKYPNHPLIRETKRECLEDRWDLAGVEWILKGIKDGKIQIRELHLEVPSPMSLALRRQTEATEMYDYSPTTMGVHLAAEESLKQVEMIEPSKEQLSLVSIQKDIPQNEKHLHTLFMIQGDFLAEELEVPVNWLETLADQQLVCYIEPGLWIAAEQEEKYHLAFIENHKDEKQSILVRLLRYHGEQTVETIAQRYLWNQEEIYQHFIELCKQNILVESQGIYYHKELYDRARRETIKSRRAQIHTVPGERYISLLLNSIKTTAPPMEQIEKTIHHFINQEFLPSMWETIILPARVKGYRGELLDNVLAQGNLFWQMDTDHKIQFHYSDEINWDADISYHLEELEGNEKIIYEALLKRGASFMQRFTSLVEGGGLFDIFMSLMEKGLVFTDSFLPVRLWIEKENLLKAPLRQRVKARSKAMSTGRWEVVRPLKPSTKEQCLERNFDYANIICRETVQGISWAEALEVLRIWEYTGRVRRGYFVEGLSGIQFIREKEFTDTIRDLENPDQEIVWLPAQDPEQLWGKILEHKKDKSFLNVMGTAVALQGGLPILLFERQGKVLRVLEDRLLTNDQLKNTVILDALQLFKQEFQRKSIYGSSNRVVVKEYPSEILTSLLQAGFIKEMQDCVLYRGIQTS